MVKDYVSVSERLHGKVGRKMDWWTVTQCVIVALSVYGCLWLVMALGELLK